MASAGTRCCVLGRQPPRQLQQRCGTQQVHIQQRGAHAGRTRGTDTTQYVVPPIGEREYLQTRDWWKVYLRAKAHERRAARTVKPKLPHQRPFPNDERRSPPFSSLQLKDWLHKHTLQRHLTSLEADYRAAQTALPEGTSKPNPTGNQTTRPRIRRGYELCTGRHPLRKELAEWLKASPEKVLAKDKTSARENRFSLPAGISIEQAEELVGQELQQCNIMLTASSEQSTGLVDGQSTGSDSREKVGSGSAVGAWDARVARVVRQCGLAGHADMAMEAVEYFEEMEGQHQLGQRPTQLLPYVELVGALASAGMIDDAKNVVNRLEARDLAPDAQIFLPFLQHYQAADDLEGAMEVVDVMGAFHVPLSPSTFNCLLALLLARERSSEPFSGAVHQLLTTWGHDCINKTTLELLLKESTTSGRLRQVRQWLGPEHYSDDMALLVAKATANAQCVSLGRDWLAVMHHRRPEINVIKGLDTLAQASSTQGLDSTSLHLYTYMRAQGVLVSRSTARAAMVAAARAQQTADMLHIWQEIKFRGIGPKDWLARVFAARFGSPRLLRALWATLRQDAASDSQLAGQFIDSFMAVGDARGAVEVFHTCTPSESSLLQLLSSIHTRSQQTSSLPHVLSAAVTATPPPPLTPTLTAGLSAMLLRCASAQHTVHERGSLLRGPLLSHLLAGLPHTTPQPSREEMASIVAKIAVDQLIACRGWLENEGAIKSLDSVDL